MPELDLSFLLIAGSAAVFAGISKGGFGSAAAFAAASILALVVEPALALGIMLPLLILIDLVTLRPFWRRWDTRSAWVLGLGGVPGVMLGAWFYTLVNADVLRILIGAISVGFVVWQVFLAGRTLLRDPPIWVGSMAGLGAGFTSFVSHAGGPIAAMYLLGLGLKKTQYQATTVVVFGALNAVKAVPYAMLGMFTWESLGLNIVLAPFAVLGAWIGVRLHHRVPERLFFNLTYILLCVTGVKLIWDGVT